jgi:hypothetical protein
MALNFVSISNRNKIVNFVNEKTVNQLRLLLLLMETCPTGSDTTFYYTSGQKKI